MPDSSSRMLLKKLKVVAVDNHFSQLPEDQILRGLVKLWKERRN